MLELSQKLVDGAIVVDRAQTAAAVRLVIERNRVVAEGAAATAVAAALSGQAGSGRIVCIVSGGNIDTKKLITILEGGTPTESRRRLGRFDVIRRDRQPGCRQHRAPK